MKACPRAPPASTPPPRRPPPSAPPAPPQSDDAQEHAAAGASGNPPDAIPLYDGNPPVLPIASVVSATYDPCPPLAGPGYELLPGLWAHLSRNAVVTFKPKGPEANCGEFELSVRADEVALSSTLTGGPPLLTGRRLALWALVRIDKDGGPIAVVRDLNVYMRSVDLDPLADRDRLEDFLLWFGRADEGEGDPERRPLPPERLSRDQWKQLCQNARDDVRPSIQGAGNENIAVEDDESSEDIDIPLAKVRAFKCKISNGSTVDFPDCEGTEGCTFRTLLEYYLRSILRTMEVRSGDKAETGVATATADVTSVGGSIVGAVAGAALLGPVGWVAGSYLGSRFGRKHSGAIAGGVAGAALFGPVGLVAGACCGASTKSAQCETEKSPAKKVTINSTAEDSIAKGACRSAGEHLSSNKYEYAGSTGVMVGATAGAVILGPVGLVAGAYLGSVSGRKIVEGVSQSNVSTETTESEGDDQNGRPYRFGDLTRGMIARGKEARGANKDEGYKFGDFTRGLFGRK